MKLGWNELTETILYETIQTLLHEQRYFFLTLKITEADTFYNFYITATVRTRSLCPS